jgi:lipopolysaccharide/colanic/teichoic acid biosynthesis glycosyltransferase
MQAVNAISNDVRTINGAKRRRRRYYLEQTTYFRIKRLLDIAIVLAASPLWVPVFVVCFLGVKVSNPGWPAFFVQLRTGFGGRRFHLVKFRSMVPNAHLLAPLLADMNERGLSAGENHFKMRGDPRATSMGKILRKYHLDELPQIINVFRGEMSLVGPRPTSMPPSDYLLWQTERFEVLPGLTGLWQLHQDEFPSHEDRVRLDILYRRQCSLCLDIKIVLLTVRHVLAGHGC